MYSLWLSFCFDYRFKLGLLCSQIVGVISWSGKKKKEEEKRIAKENEKKLKEEKLNELKLCVLKESVAKLENIFLSVNKEMKSKK